MLQKKKDEINFGTWTHRRSGLGGPRDAWACCQGVWRQATLPSLPALILVPPVTTISTHHISGLFCHTTKPPATSLPWTTPNPVLALCPLVVRISYLPHRVHARRRAQRRLASRRRNVLLHDVLRLRHLLESQNKCFLLLATAIRIQDQHATERTFEFGYIQGAPP